MKVMKRYTDTQLLHAMRQRNLVYNGDFLNYSNTEIKNGEILYNHPDGWLYKDSGSGGLITYNDTEICCQFIKSPGTALMSLKQSLHEFPRWQQQLRGNKVSATLVVSSTAVSPCRISVSLYDGIRTNTKVQSLNKEKCRIEVDILIDTNASGLFISLECDSPNANVYVHSVYANLGSVALENLPCIVEGIIGERKQYIATETAPAIELSLCTESRELSDSYTRLESVLNGRFGRGINDLSLLPDMRGYFSRAWNNGAETDPDASARQPIGKSLVEGDRAGTMQLDELASHDHGLSFNTQGQISGGNLPPVPIINKSTESKTGKYGGNETRSKNISELYTIKWA
jgi:hypothetical protein